MTMMIIAFIVLASIVILFSLFVFMSHQDLKKKQAVFLLQFSKLGSRYGMSFTSQEVLPQRIIGLDGILHKILVFETGGESIDWYLINLKEVKACMLKKIPSSISLSQLDFEQPEDRAEIIVLEFSFKSSLQSVVLPFYERRHNAINEMAVLTQKAKDWEVMLSKMLTSDIKCAK